jgi:hypothetical protein
MNLTIGLALALSSVLGTSANAQALAQPMPQAQTVEQYVREYFDDEPVMIEIARCESQFRQFDKDGKILKNPNSSAVGVFQIMSSIHADNGLGLQIDTLQGNAAYAKYLYDKQGTAPWNDSKACWGKTQSAKVLALK